MFATETRALTDKAVMTLLEAGINKATLLGQPQCIVIVDASGVILGQIRMRGAKFLSLKSAETKARTAASIRAPSSEIPEVVGLSIAAATGGEVTRLRGGFPIWLSGECLGGIGVGSGSADQDESVARAALEALGAKLF